MKTITVGFSKSKKKFAIGGYLIRKWMGTPYSHVYIKFKSESLSRILIYEAVGVGTRFIGSQAWENHALEVESFKIEVNTEGYIKLMQFCVDTAGTDYSFSQNIGLVICDLFRMKTNPFRTGKNCSEITAEILQKEGYVFDKELNLITPKDIYKVLKK